MEIIRVKHTENQQNQNRKGETAQEKEVGDRTDRPLRKSEAAAAAVLKLKHSPDLTTNDTMLETPF